MGKDSDLETPIGYANTQRKVLFPSLPCSAISLLAFGSAQDH